MSGSFDSNRLKEKFEVLTSAQDSVQTLSLWILHHKAHCEKIVEGWLKFFKKCDSKQKLNLFYLANDVIQNSKKRNARIYISVFKRALIEAVFTVKDIKIKPSIIRVLNILKERKFYDKLYVDDLIEALNVNNIKNSEVSDLKVKNDTTPNVPKDAKLIHVKNNIDKSLLENFKPKDFYLALIKNNKLGKDMIMKETDFVSTMTGMNLNVDELMVQCKDKASGQKYDSNLATTSVKLESILTFIETINNDRRKFVETLKIANAYYTAMNEDAKYITNVYRKYTIRVEAVKLKLEPKKSDLNIPGLLFGSDPTDQSTIQKDILQSITALVQNMKQKDAENVDSNISLKNTDSNVKNDALSADVDMRSKMDTVEQQSQKLSKVSDSDLRKTNLSNSKDDSIAKTTSTDMDIDSNDDNEISIVDEVYRKPDQDMRRAGFYSKEKLSTTTKPLKNNIIFKPKKDLNLKKSFTTDQQSTVVKGDVNNLLAKQQPLIATTLTTTISSSPSTQSKKEEEDVLKQNLLFLPPPPPPPFSSVPAIGMSSIPDISRPIIHTGKMGTDPVREQNERFKALTNFYETSKQPPSSSSHANMSGTPSARKSLLGDFSPLTLGSSSNNNNNLSFLFDKENSAKPLDILTKLIGLGNSSNTNQPPMSTGGQMPLEPPSAIPGIGLPSPFLTPTSPAFRLGSKNSNIADMDDDFYGENEIDGSSVGSTNIVVQGRPPLLRHEPDQTALEDVKASPGFIYDPTSISNPLQTAFMDTSPAQKRSDYEDCASAFLKDKAVPTGSRRPDNTVSDFPFLDNQSRNETFYTNLSQNYIESTLEEGNLYANNNNNNSYRVHSRASSNHSHHGCNVNFTKGQLVDILDGENEEEDLYGDFLGAEIMSTSSSAADIGRSHMLLPPPPPFSSRPTDADESIFNEEVGDYHGNQQLPRQIAHLPSPLISPSSFGPTAGNWNFGGGPVGGVVPQKNPQNIGRPLDSFRNPFIQQQPQPILPLHHRFSGNNLHTNNDGHLRPPRLGHDLSTSSYHQLPYMGHSGFSILGPRPQHGADFIPYNRFNHKSSNNALTAFQHNPNLKVLIGSRKDNNNNNNNNQIGE